MHLIKRFKSWGIKRTFALVVGASIFGFLLLRSYQGIEEIRSNSVVLLPGFLLPSAFAYIIGVLLAAKIWSDILEFFHGTSEYSFDLQVFGVSLLARKVPGIVWEAISRIALYERKGIRRSVVIVAVIAELIFRSLAGGVAFFLAIFFDHDTKVWIQEYIRIPGMVEWILLFFGALLFLLALLLLYYRFGDYLKTFQNSPETGQTSRPRILTMIRILGWIIGYLGVLFLSGLYLYLFLMSFGDVSSVSYWKLFGAFGLAVALGPSAIWLPGDIGLRDGILYLALSSSVAGSIAAVLVLAIRVWSTVVELFFGGACALTLGRRNVISLSNTANSKSHPDGKTPPVSAEQP